MRLGDTVQKRLPAAQATMMKMLVEGIMNEELPWAMILIGVFIAIVVEILKDAGYAVRSWYVPSILSECWYHGWWCCTYLR